MWLSPPADGPGKVNENHAASWFSVLTSTSAGEAFARGSERTRVLCGVFLAYLALGWAAKIFPSALGIASGR